MHCYVFAQPWEIFCCVLIVSAYFLGARVVDYLRWRTALQLQEQTSVRTVTAAASAARSTGGAQAKRRPARNRRNRPARGGAGVIEQCDPRQLYDDAE